VIWAKSLKPAKKKKKNLCSMSKLWNNWCITGLVDLEIDVLGTNVGHHHNHKKYQEWGQAFKLV